MQVAQTQALYLGLLLVVGFVLNSGNSAVGSMVGWLVQIVVLVFPFLAVRKVFAPLPPTLSPEAQENEPVTETEDAPTAMESNTWGNRWRYVTILFFFASLIDGLVRFVYLQWLNPEYLDGLFNLTMKTMEQLNYDLPEAVINEAQALMTPINYAFQTIMADCMQGVFWGLIVAFFTKPQTKKQ